jgi:hypothetical protein
MCEEKSLILWKIFLLWSGSIRGRSIAIVESKEWAILLFVIAAWPIATIFLGKMQYSIVQ